MRVRRYVGRTMADAVALLRAELGRDAVILQTRKVREKGLWGLLGRRRVEVVAALEDAPRRTPPPRPFPRPPQGTGLWEPRPSPPQEAAPRPAPSFRVPEGLRERLVNIGLSAADVEAVLQEIGQAAARVGNGQPAPAPNWRDMLVECLAARIQTVEPWELDSPPCFHALVGPTGVGKTTTVAKLAANYALVLKKKVGLIAADTYRIGAVDQLRQYAELIQAPLEVVRDPAEMREAVLKLSGMDLVLIDTVGSSPRDAGRLTALKALLDGAPGVESHLVVSATTRLPDLQDLVARFSGLQPASVIVTKLDETVNPVTIYNASRLSGRPLSFLTTGQGVPEDIEVAEPVAVARAITAAIA